MLLSLIFQIMILKNNKQNFNKPGKTKVKHAAFKSFYKQFNRNFVKAVAFQSFLTRLWFITILQTIMLFEKHFSLIFYKWRCLCWTLRKSTVQESTLRFVKLRISVGCSVSTPSRPPVPYRLLAVRCTVLLQAVRTVHVQSNTVCRHCSIYFEVALLFTKMMSKCENMLFHKKNYKNLRHEKTS